MTPRIADELEKEFPSAVRAFHSKTAGRGQTLRTVLNGSEADIACYLDADLPIPLEEIPSLLRPIEQHVADITVGKRIGKRPWKRRALTRAFSIVNRLLFDLHISDAQCGVKAFQRHALRELVPLSRENGFFLDTELLCMAKQRGFRIQEIPIHWIEQRYPERSSTVRLWRDSCRAVTALMRVADQLFPRVKIQLFGFAALATATFGSWWLDLRILSQPDFLAAHQRSAFLPLIHASIWIHALLATCAAIWIARIKRFPWNVLLAAAAIFWFATAAVAVNLHPTRSQDAFWNLLLVSGWTERGLNPYTTAPITLADHPIAFAAPAWRDLSMTHGPLWTLLLASITVLPLSIGAILLLMKMMIVVAVVASGWIFWKTTDWLGWSKERRAKICALLASSPLLMQMTAVDAHNDALVMLAVVAGFALLIKKRPWWSACVLVLGGFIKYVPWLLLPVPLLEIAAADIPLSRRLRQFAFLTVFAVTGGLLLYAPFGWSWHALMPIGKEWSERLHPGFMLVGTFFLYTFTGWNASTLRMIGLLTFALLVAWFAFRRKPVLGFTIPFFVLWSFFTPWFQPWYALWILPVMALLLPFGMLARWSIALFFMAEPFSPLLPSLVLCVIEALIFLRQKISGTYAIKKSTVSPQTNTRAGADSQST